jgi:hypothetical protein
LRPFALSELSGSVEKTSSVLGVFFLGCGALFALLMTGGLAGGKAAAGAVICEQLCYQAEGMA